MPNDKDKKNNASMVPCDCNQKELAVGQEVWVKMRITGISPGAACDCGLQVVEPYGNVTQEHCPSLYLNGSLLLSELPDDDDDIDDPEVDEDDDEGGEG